MSFPFRASRPWPTHAAAAAVAALSLTLTLVLAGCSQPASRPPADLGSTAASGTTSAPASPGAAKDTAWPYYAELNAVQHPLYRNPLDLTIRSTGTAAVLATVRPPSPYQTFGLLAGVPCRTSGWWEPSRGTRCGWTTTPRSRSPSFPSPSIPPPGGRR